MQHVDGDRLQTVHMTNITQPGRTMTIDNARIKRKMIPWGNYFEEVQQWFTLVVVRW